MSSLGTPLGKNEFPKLCVGRILVTGGTGFLGTHLTRALQSLRPRALWSTGRAGLNLLDREHTLASLKRFRPDLIFHLAAVVGGIGANRAEPGRFFYENLRMGIDLLECARRTDVQKIVLVGTVCAYPKFTPVPFRESDLWDGYPEETNAPYGLSKKMLMIQSDAYRRQYGLNSTYLLPANLYGPGDHIHEQNSHVIPALVQKFSDAVRRRESVVELWGTGDATREFLHVEDAVRGLLLAAEHYNSSEPVNIGNGREISIREAAEHVAELTGFQGEIRWNANMPDGQPRRCLDVSRARERFGFEATVPFELGIKQTAKDITDRLENVSRAPDGAARDDAPVELQTAGTGTDV